jgi:hypothetical protein
LYAAAGITTAHEGVTHAADLALMQRAAAAGANIIDVVAYPFFTDLDAVLEKNPLETWGRYSNRLKLGGAKITLDGSIQAKTGLFTTPYLTGGPGGEKDWRGEPGFPEDFVQAIVKKVYELGLPLNIHANGDGAIDLALRAHEYAAAGDLARPRGVTPLEALKAVTIHAAYEYGEEQSKGSLEPGKLADLVILDRNPLKVDPMEIKDIKVVETVKEGRTTYPAR